MQTTGAFVSKELLREEQLLKLPNLDINRVLESVKDIKLTEKEKKYNTNFNNYILTKK